MVRDIVQNLEGMKQNRLIAFEANTNQEALCPTASNMCECEGVCEGKRRRAYEKPQFALLLLWYLVEEKL